MGTTIRESESARGRRAEVRPLSLLVLDEMVSWIVFEITMKNIHRAWISRVRKAGMIVRSVDNERETMKK